MTQKLKKLSKEYGKAAVVVYFALSILDYPFFFLLVRTVGTERVGGFPCPRDGYFWRNVEADNS